MSSGKTILLNEYSWIDLDFFRTVLNDEGPVKTICDYKLEPFLVDGENFSSLVLRASVDYALGNGSNSRIHTVYLIIKANLAGLTRSRNVFAKEIHIYENIVPHLKNILRQMDNKSQLVPKYFKGDADNIEKSYLVLEDMTRENYGNIDRTQGLDFNQLSICLKSLAFWHAASAKLVDEKSTEVYDLYSPPIIHLNGTPHYKTILVNAVTCCSEAFQDDPKFADICFKLTLLKKNVFETVCAAVQRTENGLNVLLHGDLWSNNILFKKDNPLGTLPIFVDFQMSYYGSPILDLSYLLFTSSNSSIKSSDFDKLISQYFVDLIETMSHLNVSNIPTQQQLLDEFKIRGFYGAFSSLFSVPMRLLKCADGVKNFLADSSAGMHFRRNIYSNENAQEILRNLLNYFNESGFLN